MNFFKYLFVIVLFTSLVSCGSDDDICLSGEATPRMKVKFKSVEGKAKRMDSLYVDVEYKNGVKTALFSGKNVDSVMIPLRVDNTLFTNIHFHETKKGDTSVVKVNYTTRSEYVSAPCGIKRQYENVSSEVVKPNPVLNVEINQTQIVNEDKTHLYIIF